MIEKQKIERRINRRILILIFLLALYIIIILLRKYGHLPIPDSYIKGSQIFLIAVLILLIANIFIKFTEERVFRFFRDEIDLEQRIFITKIYKLAVHMIAITIILSRLGVSINNITIFLGFITTGLALALKDILISYFVWLVIIMKKPFKIGDYIIYGEVRGTIIRIGTFFTTLSMKGNSENNVIKLPNKILMDRSIHNYGSDKLITDYIKIKLTVVPRDIEKKFNDLRVNLTQLLNSKEIIDIYLDMENNNFMLNVTYKTLLDERLTNQSRVISYLYSSLKKYISP